MHNKCRELLVWLLFIDTLRYILQTVLKKSSIKYTHNFNISYIIKIVPDDLGLTYVFNSGMYCWKSKYFHVMVYSLFIECVISNEHDK